MKQHKHAELIKAWADGAEIDARISSNDRWVPVYTPMWIEEYEYRIKPEPKPDVVRYVSLPVYSSEALSAERYTTDNLRLTFDYETGKLKKAEVL